jgi:hypothetical protein
MRTLLRDRNMTQECSWNPASDGVGVATGRIDVGLCLEGRKSSMFELVAEIVRAILVALAILVPLLI